MSNVIRGFTKLTPQQVFDMAAKHALKNGEQCTISGRCSYKGIGCAESVFLTKKAREVLVGDWMFLVEDGAVPPNNAELIACIQICHDAWISLRSTDFITFFKDRMREVAEARKLDTSVVK